MAARGKRFAGLALAPCNERAVMEHDETLSQTVNVSCRGAQMIRHACTPQQYGTGCSTRAIAFVFAPPPNHTPRLALSAFLFVMRKSWLTLAGAYLYAEIA